MRKISSCILVMVMFFCLPTLASSSCPDCAGGYEIDSNAALDSISVALISDAGEGMVGLVEDMGGEVYIADAKSVALSHAEATFIPAGQSDDANLSLLYVDIYNKGKFLFVVESSVDPFDFMNPYVKIYTASGKVISLNYSGMNIDNSGFSFQENDDINNAISISNTINPSFNEIACITFVFIFLFVDMTIGLLGMVFFCFM